MLHTIKSCHHKLEGIILYSRQCGMQFVTPTFCNRLLFVAQAFFSTSVKLLWKYSVTCKLHEKVIVPRISLTYKNERSLETLAHCRIMR